MALFNLDEKILEFFKKKMDMVEQSLKSYMLFKNIDFEKDNQILENRITGPLINDGIDETYFHNNVPIIKVITRFNKEVGQSEISLWELWKNE